jgi:3-phytase
VLSAPEIAEPIQLELIDDFNPRRATGEALAAPGAAWDAALGGLSGLYYSEPERLLYAVSDDPRRFAPRLYTFEVELSQTALLVKPRAVVLLHERSPSSLLDAIDCEALTSDGAGGLLLATEGNDDRPAQQESRILRLDEDGLVTGRVPLPSEFSPEAGAASTRGVRSNAGLEGLSVSPSGRWLWAITEATLRQDGPDATFEHGAAVRLLRWDLRAATPPSQFLYHTEPVERLEGAADAQGGNGVSELVAVDDRRLLVLERAFVRGGGRGENTIRVFEVSLGPPLGADPARGVETPLPSVAKRLVLDLKDVVGRFDVGLQQLDNFEGMTLGPRLPSGARSLLLVSDDNFSTSQRSVFLAFLIRAPR